MRFSFYIFLFFLTQAFICFGQTSIKDSIWSDVDNKYYAQYCDGEPCGIWKICNKDGTVKIGRAKPMKYTIIDEKHRIYKGGWYPYGKWNITSGTDSNFRFITETYFRRGDRIYEVKHFDIWKGDTVFKQHVIVIKGKLSYNTYYHREDGSIDFFVKENGYRVKRKKYFTDTSNSINVNYLHEKTVKTWWKWRVKEYDKNGKLALKRKKIFSRDIIKKYNPTKSRFIKPETKPYYRTPICPFEL